MTFPHNCSSFSPMIHRISTLSSGIVVVCWHIHEISQTPKERSHTVSNRTTLVANSDRHCVRWHGHENFLTTTQLFHAQRDRLRRPAETTCLPYPYRPIEATKIPLSCCDNIRHSLLLHFWPHFRKSTPIHSASPKSAPNSGSLCMQWLFMNHSRILCAPDPTVLCVHISIKLKVCLIAKDDFLRKIARPLFGFPTPN